MRDASALSGYLVALVAMGVAGQWLASRTRFPSVLWMLGFAILLGPATGWLRPEEIFGPLLLPIVSLSVAIILFEGSLELRLPDLRHIGWPLFRLLTIGAATTALLTSILAYHLLQIGPAAAALLGTILVVTGPTVIGPILSTIKPSARINQLLRWEGIAIDPLGAVLALLVYEAIEPMRFGNLVGAIRVGGGQLLATIVIGILLGVIGARFLTTAISRFWVPDYLYGVASLGILLVVFEVANHWQPDSGLLVAVVMGVLTANRRGAPLERVHQFHQNLSALLIPTLFLLLGARLQRNDIELAGWSGVLLSAALILLVRPVSVFVALLGSRTPLREQVFIACLAPRGIVAAAVSSLFVLRLGEDFATIVPVTFLVIFVTVSVYGCAAGYVARGLGVSVANPQGCLILGANPVGREIAHALQQQDIPALLIDNNRKNVETARMMRLPAEQINALSDAAHAEEELDLSEIGSFLAVTGNNEVNILACRHFAEVFGRKQVFQLALGERKTLRSATSERHVTGRFLFAPHATHDFLHQCLEQGYRVGATSTTSKYTPEEFLSNNEDAMVLFTISKNGTLQIFSSRNGNRIAPESTIIALRKPIGDTEPG